MPPVDLTDETLLQSLAHARWGETGFACPHCSHPHARRIPGRPRVRVCRACRRQSSVTAGTLLSHTKLPLRVWFLRMQSETLLSRMPTATEAADEHDIARSTAWLLGHKVMKTCEVLQQWVAPERCDMLLFNVRVRPPKTAAMPETAPSYIRHTHARMAIGELHPAEVCVCLDMVPRFAGLAVVGLSPLARERRCNEHLPLPHEHHEPLLVWLGSQLRTLHHTVSLRWLPRWLHAALSIWAMASDPERQRRLPSWQHLVLATGPSPLRTLCPWYTPPPAGDG